MTASLVSYALVKKAITKSLEFFTIPTRPEALLAVITVTDEGAQPVLVNRFLVPKAHIAPLLGVEGREQELTADYFDVVRTDQAGQPRYPHDDYRARYRLVPRGIVRDDNILDYLGVDVLQHLDDPDWMPVYWSSWDHRVWDISGRPVLLPMTLRLWGTAFDLEKVKDHFESQKPAGVLSFKIVPNKCRQNWDISGTHLGELVLDLAALPIEFGINKPDPIATRSWIEDNVIRSYHDNGKYDVLGLRQFHIGPGPGVD